MVGINLESIGLEIIGEMIEEVIIEITEIIETIEIIEGVVIIGVTGEGTLNLSTRDNPETTDSKFCTHTHKTVDVIVY